MATQLQILDAFTELVLEGLTKRSYKVLIVDEDGEEIEKQAPIDTAFIGHVRQFLKDFPADKPMTMDDIGNIGKLPFAQMALRRAEKRDKRDGITTPQNS